MRRSASARLAVIAALSALLTACGLGDDPAPHVVDGPNGLKVLVGPRDAGGMEAQAGGVLALGGGGCIYLTGPDVTYLVVWPWGTTPTDDSEPGVDVPGVGRLVVGQDVSLAGGGTTLPSSQVPDLPDGCVGDTAFLVAGN